MSLSRQTQIGVHVETTEGTAATLVANDYARELSAADHTDDAGLYEERGKFKGSLSESQSLVGALLANVTWTEEVSGGFADAASATPAPFYATLRGMGFKAPVQLKRMSVSGVSGSYSYGDLIGNNATAGSATHKGTVKHFYSTGVGTGVIVYLPTTGVFATADTLTNYTIAEVTGTVASTPANGGSQFLLTSEGTGTLPASCTVERRVNGEVHQVIGARGKGKLVFQHNKPAMIEADFRGPKPVDSNNRPAAGDLVTGVATPPTPAMLGELGMPVLLGAYSPVTTKMEVTIENTLADRPTIGTGGILAQNGQAIGYFATRITGRKITISMDPEAVASGVFDYLGKWKGEVAFAVHAAIGLPSDAASGVLVVHAPYGAFNNSQWKYGDRGGIVIHDPTIKCTGSADDELEICHVFPT